MVKVLLIYILTALAMGSFYAWGNVSSEISSFEQPVIASYLIIGLFLGALFFNIIIVASSVSQKAKTILIPAVALCAAGIFYFYGKYFGRGEIASQVTFIWGESSRDYPILGYEFMALIFFVMYLATGLLTWFSTLYTKSLPEEE